MFQLEPVGSKAHIQVCGTTPCMLRGAGELIDICRHRIHHDPHHLSDDGAFSWEEVECLGACVNAPMIQVSKDTYEDLTPEIFAGLLDAFERGEQPAPGPQNGRQHAMPITGLTSLTEIAYAGDDVAPARSRSPAHAHAGAGPRPSGAADAKPAMASTQGGTNPATPAAANQEIGRVDSSGRADEAAARAPGAGAATPPKPVAETHESGPRNPGTKSDRDSNDPGKAR
jgi:NADH-quinone oxidoreductase subunit E